MIDELYIGSGSDGSGGSGAEIELVRILVHDKDI